MMKAAMTVPAARAIWWVAVFWVSVLMGKIISLLVCFIPFEILRKKTEWRIVNGGRETAKKQAVLL